ncbi:glycosyl hydrolase family 28-related protein [Horticoccus sp. 23ND18S-11]|uniref:glycosyl hydrolase family 28-related protein n=1 Tax=Horticoccus sp. 23ND18S-11 TaxID=3391832 RepID=UPI0039C92058
MTARIFFFLVLALSAFGAALPPAPHTLPWTVGVVNDASTVGVGNITPMPINPTGPAFSIVDYGADPTGVTASQAAIGAANAARITNGSGYVYAPAGIYNITDTITLNCDLYGAGMGVTTFKINHGGQTAVMIGIGTSLSNPNGAQDDITSGLTTGSTSVTLDLVDDFIVGKTIAIFLSDNMDRTQIEAGDYPFTMQFRANSYSRMHLATVTSINYGTKTVYFDKPIIFAVPPGADGYARAGQLTYGQIGMANLTIDEALHNGSALFGIWFSDVTQPWLYRVEIKNVARFGVYFHTCKNYEMRECLVNEAQVVGNPGTSGLLVEWSSSGLVEDNAFVGVTPAIEVNYSTHASVFAFNYAERAVFNINHGATNYHNLYEGNMVPQVKSDGYFGGSLYDAIFGNWLTAYYPTDANPTGLIGAIELKRLTYKASLVRNFLGKSTLNITAQNFYAAWGTPNIGNNNSYGTAKPTAGDWWVAWDPDAKAPRTWTGTVASGGGTSAGVLTMAVMGGTGGFQAHAENAQGAIYIGWSGGVALATPTQGSESGSNYSVTNVRNPGNEGEAVNLPTNGTAITVYPNNSSYQELDQDVAEGAYKIRNYYLSSASGVTGYATGESDIGANTIAASLFRSSKPAWFGNKPWPIYDTARGAEPEEDDLPAAHRYLNGNSNYLGGGSASSYRVWRPRILRK